jgi:Flp pilus assembly pilin Flp
MVRILRKYNEYSFRLGTDKPEDLAVYTCSRARRRVTVQNIGWFWKRVQTMHALATRLIGNRNGAAFVGYGLLAGLITLTAVAVAASVGTPSVGAPLGGFDETGSGVTATESVA